MLTKADIKHLAKISDLTLTDKEIEMYRSQLTKILDYVKILNSIDTDGVEPTFHVTKSINVYQSERNYEQETLPIDLVLKNANKTKDGYIIGKSKLKG